MNERQSDFELLQAYVRGGEQAAFAQLVRRHLDLVYATAFRKAQEQGAAQEVAQNAFAALARKAWQFAPDDSLPAWLYKTTLLEAKEWLRGELRRRRREQTAADLGTTMKTPDDQPALRALVPLLDEALLSLREKERTALLLRFYENQSLREVGTALGVGEDAAQKRVAGALDKLVAFFQRRGFKTATVATAAAALQHTASSAPAAVANSVALAAGQMAPPALAGLAALGARFAGWTKAQTAAVCLVIAVAPVAWQWREQDRARVQVAQLQTELLGAQTNLSSIRIEIDRLGETAARLEASMMAAGESADKLAEAKRRYEAWKARLRAILAVDDYRWPEDSPFVRIPKSVLPRLSVRGSIAPPGVLTQAARELLGLTPSEREQAEAALHTHFAAVDALVESQIFETNQPAPFAIPASTVASRVWAVPALGGVETYGQQLHTALQELLGDERWPLVKAQMDGQLRQVLNLDAGLGSQELGVWIGQEGGKWVVGYGSSGHNFSSSTSGVALDRFKPDANLPAGMEPSDYLGNLDLPGVFRQRLLQWIQQQAAQRLGKEIAR